MKLSEKFARQETEATRLARIGRRRISRARTESIRQFLGIPDDHGKTGVGERAHVCEVCDRRFSLPMHLGRHRKSKHKSFAVA
jgi:hypothetical protein